MNREQRFAHRRRIGKFFRFKGEKLGFSLAIFCLIPPPGESVPAELAERQDITRWKQDEMDLSEKYLRAFKVSPPTRYQARKLAARIRKHFPGACNLCAQPSWRMYGSGE